MSGITARDRGYTEEQGTAIATREVSVALSAGAGCGKTFVLTERFLSCFDLGAAEALRADQLNQLVAITFTERAAREMRARIRRKCYDRLLAAQDAEAGHWAELLRSLDTARISTIHSFCATLLRGRAVEAGLDPQFGVLEQAQAETLLSEAIDDELRRLVADQDLATIELAARFDLGGLAEMIYQLVQDTSPEQFEAWRNVSPAEQVNIWQAYYHAVVVPAVAASVARSPVAHSMLGLLREHKSTNSTMIERCATLAERLPTVGRHRDEGKLRSDLEELLSAARVQGGGTAKAWASPEIYEKVKVCAAALRDVLKEASGALEFDAAQALESAELAALLLAIAQGVRQRYDARKAELNVLDFGDLLARARRLLVDPANAALRERMSSQIRLLLVDEFQDTDPVQVELVEALCGQELAAGKLFFVGDHKQSIYRFRGAKPHVFRQLRERTPNSGRQSLTLNFRSQPAILHFVNALFWHELGDDYEPLHAARAQVSPTPAVEFLWAPADPAQRESPVQRRRREADWIARRLRALLDAGEPMVLDAESPNGTPAARAPRPGDIALLFRALSDVAVYEEALRRHGIDYYVVGGSAFYAQQEIFDLLNLLRSIDNANDLVSLAGVLRSGFFSLLDETIFWLAQNSAGLRAGLDAAHYPAEISAEEQRKARFAADTLAWLTSQKDQLRICELIERALERTGYDALLLNEFLGERKLANLRKLIEQARSFQQGDFLGLADFIRQLALFVVNQPDEPLAATHSEDTNVVRLMSVHQSKGLEFPIVVVPDLDRPRPNRSPAVHFDAELGPLLRIKETADGQPCTSGHDLWRIVERTEEEAELNRLLYVATTRAADYLILSSSLKSAGEATSHWMKLLERRFDLQSGEFRGELPDIEPRPAVRVTQEAPQVSGGHGTAAPRVPWDRIVEVAQESLQDRPEVFPAVEMLPADRTARRQYSFSRLAGTLHQRFDREDAVEDKLITGADARGLGTLVHAVLAAANLAVPAVQFDYRALTTLHAPRHLPSGSPHIAEAVEMLERFARSPRARQVAEASEVHAEVEFLLAWPPGAAEHKTLITGFLDLLYRDAAGFWHILDFKTNQIGRGGVEQHARPYEMQMLVYALAAERILGVAPQSLTLHFLRTDQEFSFAWNDESRRRAVELVDQGIAAAESAS